MDLVLNIADFRLKFPEFSDVGTYPDAAIQRAWDEATLFFTDRLNRCIGQTKQLMLLYYLTAHFLTVNTGIASGQLGPSVNLSSIQSATVGSASVSFGSSSAINSNNIAGFGGTEYGRRYLELLKLSSRTYMVIGGGNSGADMVRGDGGYLGNWP
jgi:hypothetical protein